MLISVTWWVFQPTLPDGNHGFAGMFLNLTESIKNKQSQLMQPATFAGSARQLRPSSFAFPTGAHHHSRADIENSFPCIYPDEGMTFIGVATETFIPNNASATVTMVI